MQGGRSRCICCRVLLTIAVPAVLVGCGALAEHSAAALVAVARRAARPSACTENRKAKLCQEKKQPGEKNK